MKSLLKQAISFALIILLYLTKFQFADAIINYRLDTSVIPEAYDIAIKPYLLPEDGAKQFTFEGEVKITLHAVVADIREITLHKDYIEIRNSWLHDSAGNLVQYFSDDDLTFESATDKLTVRMRNALTANANYTLYFKYTGQIRNGLAGFFRAGYTDAVGNSKIIGVTQLQRIDARTAFPCFDEPAFKATFRMRINRPRQYNAIFNTRLLKTEPDADDRYMDHFEETPLMSTYLVAFIISEFTSRGDADIAVITRPEYYNKTVFSHSVAVQTLKAYDEYTKLPYKELGNTIMQKAGSPVFPHNGMENWGLVIYHDSVLVNEPGYTDGWADKEYTITILVHETAHMWFGNSVTFAWWSYFWLNEAFARYYQYFLAHEIYPEYQLDQQFVVNQVHLIFGNDAVNSTQPMTSPEESIQSPSQIGYKFSGIAYAKGACIVRMIHNLMGGDNFDTAIRDYLKANHLKNTRPDDLFMHLKRQWPNEQEVNLDQFFYDWTEQVGLPILTVNVAANGRDITVHQTRFLLDPDDGSDANIRYTIPITYATDADRNFDNLLPKIYFNKTEEYLTWHLEKSIKWIILNLQQSNYYRVLYDATTLKNIQKALIEPQHSGIHVANRAQLVDDLFNYGRIGLLEYDVIFEFMEYLSYETEYLPWYAAFSGLQRISQRLTMTQQKNFRVFLMDITEKVYEKLVSPINNDTVLDVYNRNKVFSWLCKYNHIHCNNEAERTFLKAVDTDVKLAPDFRETVYCNAVRNGNFTNFYYTLWQWYGQETLPSERTKLIRAMGCTRHYMHIHYTRLLSDNVPQEHKLTALTPMYTQNLENVTPVFVMITQTIEEFAKALGSWSSAANAISNLANYFTTKEQQQLLEDFIGQKGKLFGSSETTLHNAVTNVEMNLQWANKRLGKLVKYLEERNGAAVYQLTSSLLIMMAIFAFLI